MNEDDPGVGDSDTFKGVLVNVTGISKKKSEEVLYLTERLVEEISLAVKESRQKLTTSTGSNMYILTQDRYGSTTLREFSISTRKVDIKKHYNDSFQEVHTALVKHLKKVPQNNALTFLYGPPGTGKTSYIKYLAGKLKKPLVFIPKAQLHTLTNIQTNSAVLEALKNSVIILEDCEDILKDRKGADQHPLTDLLLNITDGILLNLLQAHVIVTFNSDPDFLDPALLRPGRLFTAYKFTALTLEKTKQLVEKDKKLATKVGIITKGLTLAELYSESLALAADLSPNSNNKSSIGFLDDKTD